MNIYDTHASKRSFFFSEVDGKIYRSIVETKQKAQQIYDTARERGQTASHVKQT